MYWSILIFAVVTGLFAQWFTATENRAEEIEFRRTKTLMGGNDCATVTIL